jgi:aspartyl-tRNA synthetase
VEKLFGEKINIPETPFPRITLDDARRIVFEKYKHEMPHTEDLDPEGERLIFRHVQEEYGHDFVFVTDYPTSVRPFYHMRYPDKPNVTKSFDLLWK